MERRRRLLVPVLVLCVAAGVVVACTREIRGTAEVAPSPAMPKWHPRQPRPADRDENQVDRMLAGLDFCALIDMGVYEQRKRPGSPPPTRVPGTRRCELDRDYATLLIVRDQDPIQSYLRSSDDVLDLGGVKAYQELGLEHGQPTYCTVDIPVSFRRAIEFEQSNAADCQVTVAFAQAAAHLPALAGHVYPANGQDTGLVGACANWVSDSDGTDCDPAVDVPVPRGTDLILAAGAADPNVECAVWRDAITKWFGSDYAPIATPQACYFVEPRHRLQIETGATALGDAPGVYGTNTSLDTDRREITIGGKTAVTYRPIRLPEFNLYLSPYNDLSAHGQVRIRLTVECTRGTFADRPPMAPADEDKARQAAADVVGRYFA